ncbi:uncharacterized protein TNCV_2899141 [Trichonephila clavipes]|nr:uncharacterized protein TNCV_2899141 [Trichonephila clavipes]
MMPTWLYRQDFAKFSLNRHYNVKKCTYTLKLTTINDQVSVLNQRILDKIPGESQTYLSINTVRNLEEAVNYPTEFLNSISVSGLPPHKLEIKIGVPFILLHNSNPPKLCNGTRLRVVSLQKNVIEGRIISECGKDGDRFNSCQVIYSQFGLAIHQNDHQARRRFVEWAQNDIAVVPDFHKRILFSDEAHFWLNGYVNKQNCRIWSEANLQVYVETPLHPEKLTVWCALWAGGIIGPYFFKNDEGHNITVNGDRYRAMITNIFIPELNNHDVQELWFQQDGATCHTARATIDLLKDTFGDRLISRFGPVNWPPRSCDLTPLDYFCGAM